ncbi:hypothetical protein [Paraburkholderia phenoliruptrix]|uniref:Uncharacterized protein n=2 Tax=Paraburkholderia phenoliruptrix TaxID=252970 RepID=A0A6J5KEX0_9BURK|nr:hypothetical protein [Paraburkholderia phenoliruptrix]AFT86522.1 hypothetical protein BUPH_02946 [Paraburkholderia phenoliruptrix BR3459a]MDR6389289.1 hypothetical protein [Paraburkholderia phenoliruptrix]CAB4051434.1 hypothetical protein LMG9964_05113 [Paraburkholderia phenoliruptrix]
MKSRVIDSFRLNRTRLPGMPPVHAALHARLPLRAASGLLLAASLAGCYYPYGYYPAYYPGYPSYYATVPAGATRREVPPATAGDSSVGPSTQQQPPVQQGQQIQPEPGYAGSPPAYVVAEPPVYVAPAYPVYYPPPVYPAWYGYGYPGWYGPAVSIGFGWSWGGGGRGRHH